MKILDQYNATLDLAKLILRGISALQNSHAVSSYIGRRIIKPNPHLSDKDTGHPVTWMQDQDLLISTESSKFSFKTLYPARVEVLTPQHIAYNLLDEQLFMYLSLLVPSRMSKNNKSRAEAQIRKFIDISLDPGTRANLVTLRSIIELIESIRLENYLKVQKFKEFLDTKDHFWFRELWRFNSYARRLGLKKQVWNATHYAIADSMLQDMILAVDSDRGTLTEDVINYVSKLEQFLLLPISEAIKLKVDPSARNRKENPFYVTLYKIINHNSRTSSDQEFFMIPRKLTYRL